MQIIIKNKKAFFRATSHEIRTPANTVFLGCQMLHKELSDIGCSNKEVFDILEDIRAASEVTIQLVSDLLSQDKIEEGTMQLDKAPVGIWAVVKESVRLFTSQVRDMNMQIT